LPSVERGMIWHAIFLKKVSEGQHNSAPVRAIVFAAYRDPSASLGGRKRGLRRNRERGGGDEKTGTGGAAGVMTVWREAGLFRDIKFETAVHAR